MLRICSLLVVLSVIIVSCSGELEFSGKFGYSPQTISPGDEVTIYYNPDSTILSGSRNIQCIAYLFNRDLINTVDVPLSSEKNYLTGKIKSTDSTLGLILKFKTDDQTDNNEKNGYIILFSDEYGKPIPGSKGGYAAAINRWGAYYLDMERNKEKALELFEEEFKTNPDQKRNFSQSYFDVIYSVKTDDKDKILNDELIILENYDNKSDEDYFVLAKYYNQIGNKDKADEYIKLLEENFPQSKYYQQKKFEEFSELNDINEKIKFLQEYEKKFSSSEYTPIMYDLVAKAYRDNKDYTNALKYLIVNKDRVIPFRFYSIVRNMLQENADLEIALQIAQLGVPRNRQEVKNPTEKKPEYYSESEWLAEREYILGVTLFVEADLLHRKDKNADCIPQLEEAILLTKNKEGDINELYSQVLVEKGENKKAIEQIGKFIELGYGTASMKEYLREAYNNEKGSSEGFEDFVLQFEAAADKRLAEKLESEMISKPAPDFTLLDLDGNQVSLNNFKGKVVIVDFWATWCGPCLASFPGMKKAVEKYKDNSNVKFLFVNTWERVENKKKNASDFIKTHEYPFHVLLDEKNEVIEKFKVSGIPTKFIIDKNSHIRFMNVGYSGSEDQLIKELSTMISMVQ